MTKELDQGGLMADFSDFELSMIGTGLTIATELYRKREKQYQKRGDDLSAKLCRSMIDKTVPITTRINMQLHGIPSLDDYQRKNRNRNR